MRTHFNDKPSYKSSSRFQVFWGLINRIWQGIRCTKIQTRLMISFVLLSSIPLFITGYFSYYNSSNTIKAKVSTYSLQLMNQVGKNIDDQLVRLINDSISIEFTDIVQDTLLNYDDMTEWEKHNRQYEMNYMFSGNFSYLDYVSNVTLITKSREVITIYGDWSNFKMNLKDSYIDFLFDNAVPKDGVPFWSAINAEDVNHFVRLGSREEEGILITRAIKNIENDVREAILTIMINKRIFSDIYKDMDIVENTDIFVINSKGIVVSSINPDIAFSSQYKYPLLIERIYENKDTKGHAFDINLDGNNFLVATYPLKYADWQVVTTIPYSYLNSESKMHGLSIMYLGIVCLVLAVILSLLISSSISVPLSNLIYSMDKVKKGNLDVSVSDWAGDEVGEVARNYNTMLKDLKQMISEVREMEKQKRIAEFKSLQAQINPHFLSNTLNTIRGMAVRQKADNIANIITSLIELLRVCIGEGDEFIFIHEELDYLKAYINIQQYKHYNEFDVHFEINEEILYSKIPRLLCQPIVENAIIHGIGPSNKQGVIVIKGYKMEDKIKIVVTDNGVGINKEKLEKLLNNDNNQRNPHFTGVGMKNVEDRIKMIFGDEYGIHIESVPDFFTNVEITIPAYLEDE